MNNLKQKYINEKSVIGLKITEQKRKLRQAFSKAKTIFIMAHKNLDLDALGSSIGLAFLLQRKNKNSFLIINDKDHELGVEKVLQELDGCLNIIKGKEVEKNLYLRSSRNLLIILDTNKKNLVQDEGVLDFFDEDRIIILDHHELGETSIPCYLRIIDNEISSTCEMITNLIESYRIDLDPYYATLLLSGIVLDTNNFTLKTNKETYYSAYFLACMGASPRKVQYLLKQELEDYRERQKLMTNVDIIEEKIAIAKGSPYAIYRKEDLAKMADTLLFFNKIELSFVIAKTSENITSLSGRSIGKRSISPILERIGGGGDKMGGAAQFKNMPISKVEEKLKKSLKKEE